MSAEFAESLSSPEVSPIKGGGPCITPQTKTRSKLSIQSPGVSPICANPGNLEDDQGSFIQEPPPGNFGFHLMIDLQDLGTWYIDASLWYFYLGHIFYTF